MPIFAIDTNCDVSDEQSNRIMQNVTEIISNTLEKPKFAVAVMLEGNKKLIWGGSSEPAAICTLKSIGKVNKELNTKVSEAIGELLNKELDIAPTRYYINFNDFERHNFGNNKKVY